MVVVIETNIKKWNKFLSNLPRKMIRKSSLTIRRSLDYGVEIAKIKAPIAQGDLKAGIRGDATGISNKLEGRIISTVPGMFKYNLWVNRSPGWELLDVDQIQLPFFKPGQTPFLYGDSSAMSPGGKGIRWTGEPKFFTNTMHMLRKLFPHLLVNEIRLELNKGLGGV